MLQSLRHKEQDSTEHLAGEITAQGANPGKPRALTNNSVSVWVHQL